MSSREENLSKLPQKSSYGVCSIMDTIVLEETTTS